MLPALLFTIITMAAIYLYFLSSIKTQYPDCLIDAIGERYSVINISNYSSNTPTPHINALNNTAVIVRNTSAIVAACGTPQGTRSFLIVWRTNPLIFVDEFSVNEYPTNKESLNSIFIFCYISI